MRQWVIPPEHSGEFVWHLEGVLEVYTRPHTPRFPQVCLEETSKQLLREPRAPVPMEPGQPERMDYEHGL